MIRKGGVSVKLMLLFYITLAIDFYKYAKDFFGAAECVVRYLGEEAAVKYDIAKLDIWYFAMIYLYRQSLELLLKANIFQVVVLDGER